MTPLARSDSAEDLVNAWAYARSHAGETGAQIRENEAGEWIWQGCTFDPEFAGQHEAIAAASETKNVPAVPAVLAGLLDLN